MSRWRRKIRTRNNCWVQQVHLSDNVRSQLAPVVKAAAFVVNAGLRYFCPLPKPGSGDTRLPPEAWVSEVKRVETSMDVLARPSSTCRVSATLGLLTCTPCDVDLPGWVGGRRYFGRNRNFCVQYIRPGIIHGWAYRAAARGNRFRCDRLVCRRNCRGDGASFSNTQRRV